MDEVVAHRLGCPYEPGFSTELYRHVPPDPFIADSDFRNPEWFTNRERSAETGELSRLEVVMSSPPVDRTTSRTTVPRHTMATAPATLQLTITEVLSGGDLRGAQVVLCTIEQSRKPSFTAVAQLYDPLYCPYYEHDPDGRKTRNYLTDTPWLADSEYSREAATYEQLQDKKLTEGSFTPAYYGSYTLTLPAYHKDRSETTRKVRLVLVEYVDGISMHDLEKTVAGDYVGEGLRRQLDEKYRLCVWARILQCKTLTRHAYVSNNDDFPRNRIIAPSPRNHVSGPPASASVSSSREQDATVPSSSFQLRVVLIDFGSSAVWPRSDIPKTMRQLAEYKHSMPINPLTEHWGSPFAGPYRAWVPDWYFEDDAKRHQWLIAEFIEGGEDMKYEKVDHVPEPGKKMHTPDWTWDSP